MTRGAEAEDGRICQSPARSRRATKMVTVALSSCKHMHLRCCMSQCGRTSLHSHPYGYESLARIAWLSLLDKMSFLIWPGQVVEYLRRRSVARQGCVEISASLFVSPCLRRPSCRHAHRKRVLIRAHSGGVIQRACSAAFQSGTSSHLDSRRRSAEVDPH